MPISSDKSCGVVDAYPFRQNKAAALLTASSGSNCLDRVILCIIYIFDLEVKYKFYNATSAKRPSARLGRQDKNSDGCSVPSDSKLDALSSRAKDALDLFGLSATAG